MLQGPLSESIDTSRVTPFPLRTESHGVNRPNLVECIKRVKLQIAEDGVLTVERSADLGLLKTAMHEDLL